MGNDTNSTTPVEQKPTGISEVELVLGRICPIVGLFGFVFNLLTFLVFSHGHFKETLYCYLKTESLLICLNFLITIFKAIYYCFSCPLSQTFVMQLYQIYLNIYLASALEMSAIICRNFSAFICLLIIYNNRRLDKCKQLFLRLKTFRVAIVLIVSFSLLFYLYEIFELEIGSYETDDGKTVYYMDNSQFGNSHFKQRLEILATVVRDGLNLLALVVLNVLIIWSLKVNLRKKKTILNGMKTCADDARTQVTVAVNEETPPNKAGDIVKCKQMKTINRKEIRQTVMVVLTCLNYLIGRLPILYYFVKRNLSVDQSNFGIYAILVSYVSYAINIFLYYNSNSRFRFVFNSYLKKSLNCFIRG
jgi:hypothetical protein